MRDRSRLKSYEFLHATFGEYLIARLVVQELSELAAMRELPATRALPRAPDDAFLHAVLSFAPLTLRTTVVSFIDELMAGLPRHRKDNVLAVLLDLFHTALQPRRNTSLEGYQPVPTTVPLRHAVYSANLCLLAVIAAGEITSDQLFPDTAGQAQEWNTIARLWQSQLPGDGWLQLTHRLTVARDRDGEQRQIRISSRSDGEQIHFADPYWTYDIHPESPYRQRPGMFGWIRQSPDVIRAVTAFLCGVDEDTLTHALEPLLTELGRTVTTFYEFDERGPVSAARALITLWLASTRGPDQNELTDAAETCLQFAIHGFAPFDDEVRHQFRILALRQFRSTATGSTQPG